MYWGALLLLMLVSGIRSSTSTLPGLVSPQDTADERSRTVHFVEFLRQYDVVIAGRIQQIKLIRRRDGGTSYEYEVGAERYLSGDAWQSIIPIRVVATLAPRQLKVGDHVVAWGRHDEQEDGELSGSLSLVTPDGRLREPLPGVRSLADGVRLDALALALPVAADSLWRRLDSRTVTLPARLTTRAAVRRLGIRCTFNRFLNDRPAAGDSTMVISILSLRRHLFSDDLLIALRQAGYRPADLRATTAYVQHHPHPRLGGSLVILGDWYDQSSSDGAVTRRLYPHLVWNVAPADRRLFLMPMSVVFDPASSRWLPELERGYSIAVIGSP